MLIYFGGYVKLRKTAALARPACVLRRPQCAMALSKAWGMPEPMQSNPGPPGRPADVWIEYQMPAKLLWAVTAVSLMPMTKLLQPYVRPKLRGIMLSQ